VFVKVIPKPEPILVAFGLGAGVHCFGLPARRRGELPRLVGMLGDVVIKPLSLEPQPAPPTRLKVYNASPLDDFSQSVGGHPKVFGGGVEAK
jgi:hypothetical protein